MTAHVDPNPIIFTNIGPMAEGGTGRYEGTLTQEDGTTAVPGSVLQTLKLTLKDISTGEVINSRDAQNVLNLNGVTVDEDGRLVWTILPDDLPFLRKNPPPFDHDVEPHVAVFEWTWNDTKRGRKKVFVLVEKFLASFGPGVGEYEYTDLIYSPDSETPIADAIVWATSDADGDTIVAGPVKSDTAGSFTLKLDAGSYYLWINHESYTFEAQAITVPLVS